MQCLRILVVEDEPINAEILELLLTREGHAVCVAQTGPEAVEATARFTPDLILMDLQMPGEYDGFEAIRRLRGRGYSGVIVCQSARVAGPEQAMGFEAGADGFLPKPFKRRDVLEVVEHYAPRFQSVQLGG